MSRLEEIIQYEHTTPKGRHYVGFKSEEDFKRLINQAQKAEELQAKVEGLIGNYKIAYSQNEHHRKLAERYKQALEFYADRFKYHEMLDQSGVLTVIEDDCGFTARQALKGVEGYE
ncbi:hypothetical protein AQ616_18750 [Oceanobacillus sp. E9]|uniref:hypothetical protein n=1 Tax=Oceanobacillus sp. E9 TaxID=1742575 RepID=UPI00084E7505|nr:hypothetical protein [Oceanobacillus sp. E9]OEH52945.1 hypothetical protein AQ616_18750 [Oceanobacillus sp. E9]